MVSMFISNASRPFKATKEMPLSICSDLDRCLLQDKIFYCKFIYIHKYVFLFKISFTISALKIKYNHLSFCKQHN